MATGISQKNYKALFPLWSRTPPMWSLLLTFLDSQGFLFMNNLKFCRRQKILGVNNGQRRTICHTLSNIHNTCSRMTSTDAILVNVLWILGTFHTLLSCLYEMLLLFLFQHFNKCCFSILIDFKHEFTRWVQSTAK